jgi:hypothetical protein
MRIRIGVAMPRARPPKNDHARLTRNRKIIVVSSRRDATISRDVQHARRCFATERSREQADPVIPQNAIADRPELLRERVSRCWMR